MLEKKTYFFINKKKETSMLCPFEMKIPLFAPNIFFFLNQTMYCLHLTKFSG